MCRQDKAYNQYSRLHMLDYQTATRVKGVRSHAPAELLLTLIIALDIKPQVAVLVNCWTADHQIYV